MNNWEARLNGHIFFYNSKWAYIYFEVFAAEKDKAIIKRSFHF